MSADTVTVQDDNVEPEAIVEQPIEMEAQLDSSQEARKEEQVPLSAHIKERRKRQEVEQELKWYKEQAMRPKAVEQVKEPDDSHLEPATRQELGMAKHEVIREVDERTWKRDNPEKLAEINDKLQEFLKQRPHLAAAIDGAPNRYEEAWTLMEALTPKQKAALKPAAAPKKDTPGNPAAIPKATAMNQAVDVMSMTDSEFNTWRNAQRKRR